MHERNFTFFPYNDEEDLIAGTSAEELGDWINEEPEMGGRYLHQLLKQGRRNDGYTALKAAKLSPQKTAGVVSDLITSTAMMRGMFDVSEEEGNVFVHESMDLIFRAVNDLPVDDPLDENTAGVVEDLSKTILLKAEVMTKMFKSKMS